MAALARVIPIKPRQHRRARPAPQPWMPEPVQLYGLIVLTFVLHIPVTAGGTCGQCGEVWPCTKIRLAYRLREGF